MWWKKGSSILKSLFYLRVRFIESREILAVTQTFSTKQTKNKKDNHWHAFGIDKLILFKLSTLIDASELYVLMLVWVTLTLIQGHRGTKQQKLLCQLFHNISGWFKWNLICYWDMLVWWTSYFIFNHLTGKKPCWTDLEGNRLSFWLANFFQYLYDDIHSSRYGSFEHVSYLARLCMQMFYFGCVKENKI